MQPRAEEGRAEKPFRGGNFSYGGDFFSCEEIALDPEDRRFVSLMEGLDGSQRHDSRKASGKQKRATPAWDDPHSKRNSRAGLLRDDGPHVVDGRQSLRPRQFLALLKNLLRHFETSRWIECALVGHSEGEHAKHQSLLLAGARSGIEKKGVSEVTLADFE